MKILLDECVDRRLAREIVEHTVTTVPRCGWAGIKNGELISLADSEFDVFVTVDRNLSYQQNLTDLQIRVLVIQSKSNRYVDLKPFGPKVADAIKDSMPGSLILLR